MFCPQLTNKTIHVRLGGSGSAVPTKCFDFRIFRCRTSTWCSHWMNAKDNYRKTLQWLLTSRKHGNEMKRVYVQRNLSENKRSKLSPVNSFKENHRKSLNPWTASQIPACLMFRRGWRQVGSDLVFLETLGETPLQIQHDQHGWTKSFILYMVSYLAITLTCFRILSIHSMSMIKILVSPISRYFVPGLLHPITSKLSPQWGTICHATSIFTQFPPNRTLGVGSYHVLRPKVWSY